MADFDVQAARKAGYTDAEIADHLASQRGFDVGAARQSGYKDAEIVDHLSPGPGLLRRGMNAVGDAVSAVGNAKRSVDDYVTTQAVRAGGGLASLPGTVAKGAEWGYRQLGIDPASIFGQQGAKVLGTMASDYPTADKISDTVQSAANVRPVNLEGNIPGGKIIDTGMQGGLGALMTGGASIPGFLAGVGGGLGSESLGQVAQAVAPNSPGLETVARLTGALGGGVAGAVTPSVVRKAGDVATGLRAPFTQPGQDKILGTALRDVAADPDAAVTNLQKYQIGREAFPDSVPGFKLDAGKASRDPGLMAAAEVIPSGVRGLNVQNNNRLLTEALDNAATGMPPAADARGMIQKALSERHGALNTARSNAASPLFEATRNFPEDLPVGKLFKYVDDAMAANKGEHYDLMKEARDLLFKPGTKQPDFSAAGLDNARKALSPIFAKATDKHGKELLQGLKTRIDETMSSIPEARAANETFKQYSVPLEPFGKKGAVTPAGKAVEVDTMTKKFVLPEGKVLSDLKAPDVQNILMASAGDPTVKRNIASLYLDDFKSTVGNNVQKDAAGNPMLGASPAAKWMDKHRGAARNVLTDDQIKALDDITKHLGDQAQAVPGRTGSPTFDRLASESILKAVIGRKEVPAWLHPIQKAVTLNGVIDIYGGANKQMLEQMLKVIEDPALTAALMKKATPGNVKMMEPLLKSIGQGAALPVSTAGERGSP
jgi:hypothetical protein